MLGTIEKRKERIIRIYESVVSIIVLMLWMVDVRLKVDVILFLKVRNLLTIYSREYVSVIEMETHYLRIERKSKFKALQIEMCFIFCRSVLI